MKLPNSWKDITVRQFMDIDDLKNDTSIGKSNPSFAALELECHLIALLSGESYTDIEADKDIVKISRQLAFLNEMPSEKQVNRFWLNGYTWHVNNDIRTLSFGEYIDLDSFAKEGIKKLPELMAIFCQPYRLFKVKMTMEEKIERMKVCPITIAYPLSVFFCKVLEGLMNNLVISANGKLELIGRELKDMESSLLIGDL
jgi:hypothetical protein